MKTSPIGRRITDLLKARGASPALAADYVGCSESTVLKWTSGIRAPSFENGVKLSRFLELDPWELAFGTKPPQQPPLDPPVPVGENTERALADRLDRIEASVARLAAAENRVARAKRDDLRAKASAKRRLSSR